MDYKRSAGDKWVARGNVSAYDFTETDFTGDSTWRDLDFSSVVPAGTKWIRIILYVKGNTLGSYFQLRESSVSEDYNRKNVQIRVPAITEDREFTFRLSADYKIQYKRQAAVVFPSINMVVTHYS